MKDELFIYKNDDSEDYEFIIKGDIGERYQNSFYHQVRDVVYSGWKTFLKEIGIFRKITMIKDLSLRKIGNIQRV